MKLRTTLRTLGLLTLAVLTSQMAACSSGFQKSWREASRPSAKAPYVGRWTGTWQSSQSKHRGHLECVLEAKPYVDVLANTYPFEATFHAHWGGLSSTYRVPLNGTDMGKSLFIQGSQDLGPLQGGVYEYKGSVTASRFDATYTSKYDRGTFTLRRPTSPLLHQEKERPQAGRH